MQPRETWCSPPDWADVERIRVPFWSAWTYSLSGSTWREPVLCATVQHEKPLLCASDFEGRTRRMQMEEILKEEAKNTLHCRYKNSLLWLDPREESHWSTPQTSKGVQKGCRLITYYRKKPKIPSTADTKTLSSDWFRMKKVLYSVPRTSKGVHEGCRLIKY